MVRFVRHDREDFQHLDNANDHVRHCRGRCDDGAYHDLKQAEEMFDAVKVVD
jgi:hypothetical protein